MRLSGKSRLVALVAALGIALLGMLPAAHRHTDDGGAIVHRHAVNLAGDHHHHDHDEVRYDGRLGSDHHAAAQLLPDEYRAAAAFSMAAPTAAAFELAEPRAACLTRGSDRVNLLPTHDPPLRYFSSPAPPLAS